MTALGNWTVANVAGHPCDLFEPRQRNPHGYVVVYLHGVHLNKLLDKEAFVEQFEQYGLPVVCPNAGRSWWTDRICREFDTTISAEQYVLQRIVPFLAERFRAEAPRIALLGTSMGGQGALRLAYKYPHLFPVCAAISPAIDYQARMEEPDEDEPLCEMYEDPEQARQDTALLHIHPLNWPRHQFFSCDPTDERWFDSADRLRMKLSSIGIPFECDLESTGGGHSFEYYGRMAPRAVAFLVQALDRERLRVL
jgi:S-formylglutathione hydrolase FrmB